MPTPLIVLFALWALLAAGLARTAEPASNLVVGVSWAYFQEERWKTDEAAIRAGLSESGARYVATDAQGSSEKQIADVESLVARGAGKIGPSQTNHTIFYIANKVFVFII